MIYELVKVGHLASLILWMGAAITLPMAALYLVQQEAASHGPAIRALRQAYLWLGGIGIVATWVFGLILVSLGQWLNAPWMMAKLAVVLILSGLHGAFSGRLRRLARDEGPFPSGLFKALLGLHALGLLMVLTLVLLKPY